MNIQALTVKKGKVQHMIAGMVYSVTKITGDALIDSGKAIAAKEDMKVGQVYKEKATRNRKSAEDKGE